MRRFLVTAICAVLFSIPTSTAVAADSASVTASQNAINWLDGQQQSNGGFDSSGLANTADAVLAIGEEAQSGASWSKPQALAAVQAFNHSSGNDPLDYVNSISVNSLSVEQAAILVTHVSAPLGLSTTAYMNKVGNPAGNGSFGTFNATLRAALAKRVVDGSVPSQTVTFIRNAQQSNGGWDSNGNPGGTEVEFVPTALAVEVLIASGATAADGAVDKALKLFATWLRANGSWDESVTSTAYAIRAIRAAGFEVAAACWRDIYNPSQAGFNYASPDAFLRNSQSQSGNIGNVLTTSQAVASLLRLWVPVARQSIGSCTPAPPHTFPPGQGGITVLPSTNAYWFVRSNISFDAYRITGNSSSLGFQLNAPVVDVAMIEDARGAWAVGSDGGVFALGDAPFWGASATRRNVKAIAAAPNGNGYWTATSGGTVSNMGVTSHFGDLGGLRLNQPIVGMASTPSGNGYWLVASDGGIFAFGAAGFHGSTGAIRLNQPIVGMASTPSGNGYWLVASDGGVFSFGDAGFYGSMGAIPLNAPIIDMAASPSGGYWLFASDGGVFAFGGAPFLGASTGAGPFVAAGG